MALLEKLKPDFEYEGPISVEKAFNRQGTTSKFSGPVNILIMADLKTARISTQLLKELGQATLIGPILMGLEKPVQIAHLTTPVSVLVTLALCCKGGKLRPKEFRNSSQGQYFSRCSISHWGGKTHRILH